MLLCDKLIQLRREKGYSQEQLANMLNVSRQAVSKWEAGNSTPEIEKIINIAEIFNVSLDFLLRDNLDFNNRAEKADNNLDNANVMMQLDEIKQCIKRQHLYEYKSEKKVFGIPLVHIKISRNSNAVARGIIAIGNVSIGLLSIGGIALGLISIGGIALGLLLALAGVALGGISFAGVSFGMVAFGGVSIGVYAAGGVAVASKIAAGAVASGNIAFGQVVDGAHTLHTGEVTREQMKMVILDQYPNINKMLLKIILDITSM
jgi:transcriptional regulator with XRE-family HTH domain